MPVVSDFNSFDSFRSSLLEVSGRSFNKNDIKRLWNFLLLMRDNGSDFIIAHEMLGTHFNVSSYASLSTSFSRIRGMLQFLPGESRKYIQIRNENRFATVGFGTTMNRMSMIATLATFRSAARRETNRTNYSVDDILEISTPEPTTPTQAPLLSDRELRLIADYQARIDDSTRRIEQTVNNINQGTTNLEFVRSATDDVLYGDRQYRSGMFGYDAYDGYNTRPAREQRLIQAIRRWGQDRMYYQREINNCQEQIETIRLNAIPVPMPQFFRTIFTAINPSALAVLQE